MIIIYHHQVKYHNVQLESDFDLTEFDLIHETYAINHVDGELKQNLFLSHLDQCTFIVIGKITKSSWLLI